MLYYCWYEHATIACKAERLSVFTVNEGCYERCWDRVWENIYCLRASSCVNEPTDKIILLALRLDCSCREPAKVSQIYFHRVLGGNHAIYSSWHVCIVPHSPKKIGPPWNLESQHNTVLSNQSMLGSASSENCVGILLVFIIESRVQLPTSNSSYSLYFVGFISTSIMQVGERVERLLIIKVSFILLMFTFLCV